MNTKVNKSVYAVAIGAGITVLQNVFPDLMPIELWGSIEVAVVGLAVYFITNKPA